MDQPSVLVYLALLRCDDLAATGNLTPLASVRAWLWRPLILASVEKAVSPPTSRQHARPMGVLQIASSMV